MRKKVILWVLLACICVAGTVGYFGVQAAIAGNSILQVCDDDSLAVIQDGKIVVSLEPKDVFTYNEILDLSAATKDVPLLNLEFNPNVIGVADATKIEFRFTDVYDENNYVILRLTNVPETWANGHSYLTAGAADQPQIGIENVDNPDKTTVHINSFYNFGTPISFSMVGLPNESTHTMLTVYFDYEEKAFYAEPEIYSWGKRIVTDLDKPAYYGDNLWTGFTSGMVKMTVTASNYQSDTCNFAISTINGKSQFQDTGDVSAPIISVDTGYAPEDIPTAVVGRPYRLFAASAIDGCDGEVAVASSVYYGYNSENPVNVTVDDGCFTPTEEGEYVIAYTATDLSGNTATECVYVNAVKGDGLQVTLQDMVTETDTGTPIKVVSAIACTDASGNVSYCVKAKHLTSGEEIEIDSQTLEFVPMADGDWEITVTAQDYISTVEKTFTVKSNHTTQPKVLDNAPVPEYFILGATYQLPVLSGYDFSSGKGVLTDMGVFVMENGGQEEEIENGQYIPEKAGSVTVTYRLTVDGKTCEKTYAATVVNVGYKNLLNLSKYFVDPTGAATATASSTSITYTVNQDTKLDFVNFVQVKNLTFSFQVGEKNAYNKVHIYLTDTVSGKQVKLSYNRTAEGATFCVNDGAEKNLSSAFDTAVFSLGFSNDTHIVTPEEGIQIEVEKFLDGSCFTGFTNSVARFSVEVGDVSGASQILLSNLNSRALCYTLRDKIVPQYFVDSKAGEWGIGEQVVLTGAFAYDVLDPVTTLTLQVTAPNGAYVTDENGVLLNGTQDSVKDYTFTLEQYGDYTVKYVVTDGKDNTEEYAYCITSKDLIAPTITVSDPMEFAKTGETVAVAGVEVSDNITAECTVITYVYDPEGIRVEVTDGIFEATQSGVYSVRYMAFDEDGNYAFASYEVDSQPEKVDYISQSMSLGSDLSLHLWGNVPQSYVDSLSGTLVYDDAAKAFKLSELSPNADGLYHMQAEMAVAQMTENVDLVLSHNTIGQVIHKTYSVRDYLVTLVRGDYDQQTKDLCLELLNFGAMAQQYFRFKTYDLANKGYEITPANAIPEAMPSVNITGSTDGIRFYGTSVRFLSQTAVRFYFKAEGGVESYTFTIDGAEYEPVAKDGLYYIETPGINPQDMSKEITVDVSNGTDTLSVTYAPMWYFIRTYNKSGDAAAKNLMAAAYSYYKEAEAYVGGAVTPGSVQQPETPTGQGVYICLDVLITTLGNSTEDVDIGFFPHNFEGDINNYTDKISVTAGTTTTVKLNAEKYMVDGVIPDGLGIAIFGGPTWDAKLSDGYTPDRHTLTISGARLEGAFDSTIDLRTAAVTSGTNGTGYTNANSSGTASIVDGAIVITGGFRYDGHKITLGVTQIQEKTYICLDMQITTLGNSTNPVDVGFFPYNFEGDINNYTKKLSVTAGTTTTVKLDLNDYLVDGELPGIGFAIFGGPEWNSQLADGTYDRHTITITNIRLEGELEQTFNLSNVTVVSGTNGTGYTNANGSGVAAIVDNTIVITGGYRYDGHKITFGDSDES